MYQKEVCYGIWFCPADSLISLLCAASVGQVWDPFRAVKPPEANAGAVATAPSGVGSTAATYARVRPSLLVRAANQLTAQPISATQGLSTSHGSLAEGVRRGQNLPQSAQHPGLAMPRSQASQHMDRNSAPLLQQSSAYAPSQVLQPANSFLVDQRPNNSTAALPEASVRPARTLYMRKRPNQLCRLPSGVAPPSKAVSTARYATSIIKRRMLVVKRRSLLGSSPAQRPPSQLQSLIRKKYTLRLGQQHRSKVYIRPGSSPWPSSVLGTGRRLSALLGLSRAAMMLQ